MNNDAVKKAVYDNLATKVNAIVIKIPSTSGTLTEKQYEQRNKVLRRRLKLLTEKYLILVGWSRRLITTQ